MYPSVDFSIEDDGMRLNARTQDATALTLTTNEHGIESISADIPATATQAFDLYSRLSASTRAVLSAAGPFASGRCEDIKITNGGVDITALGDWRALSDVPYTAFWSSTQVKDWRPVTPQDIGAFSNPEKYQIDTNNRLYLGLTKDTDYGYGSDYGLMVIEFPDGGSRGATGAQFTITYNLPANWVVGVYTYDAAWSGIATPVSIVTSAGASVHAWHVAFASAQKIIVGVYNATGGAYTNAAETGDYYMRVTDLRMVSDTTNRVNTTLSGNVSAGSSVSCPVGSTTGMYAGMQLCFNSGNTGSEIATVSSITDATHVVVASLASNHTTGQAVQGHRVLADAIVKDVRTELLAVNPGAPILASDARIVANTFDLTDAVYEDASMADVLTDLAARGDGTQLWETGVDADQYLFFRPQGTAAQTWYVDAASVKAQQTLSQLVNSAYGVYKEAGGRLRRTAVQADAASISRYGMTRREAVRADTSNATLATTMASNAVREAATPIPQSSISFDRVYTASGAVAPLYLVRAGDTFVIRNLPPSTDTAIDQIRIFRLARTEYDAIADTLKVVPASPLPELEYQLAQALKA